MSQPKLYYYMAASSKKMPTQRMWVEMGTDRDVALHTARMVENINPMINIAVGTETKSVLYESTRSDLDGLQPADETFGATLVDFSPPVEPQDGKPRYYGVVYFPAVAGEQWMWRWTPPEKDLAKMIERHGGAIKAIAGLPVPGLQVRICQTVRTDMEGYQVAGKPEDGEWVDLPEKPSAPEAPKKYYYGVCKAMMKGVGTWEWSRPLPFPAGATNAMLKEMTAEYNRMQGIAGTPFEITTYVSERGDLHGEHPKDETFGAEVIK